ncbi:MAG: YciI family protein [Gammaproteobacteria bacterium]|nr:YciI family protein [Gammaproteobacteria bacterium]
MYIVVFGTDKPGMVAVRSSRFDDYRAYLLDHPDHPDVVVHHSGSTLSAGDPASTTISTAIDAYSGATPSEDGTVKNGSLIVLDAPSVEAARAFVADSPFGRVELFGELHIRPLVWVVGRPD